jgi:NADPH:quinone reductase-like Zn-dependent oxidoreductase
MSDRTEYAVTVTAREQVELRPVEPDSAPLGPREIAGRTLASLVSAGTELAAHFRGSRFPAVPGYAAVFEVERVGAEVEGVAIGARAFCMGPHRSFQRVPQERAWLVPAGLAPDTAVFARMMSVSMSTLTTTVARPPETVVVSSNWAGSGGPPCGASFPWLRLPGARL